jgi:hypothetical protein
MFQRLPTLQFIALAIVFLLHQTGVGLATQPLFTLLRNVLSESQLPLVTWVFPIGTVGSFFFAKSFDHWITRNIPAIIVAAELLTGLAYYSLYCQCSSMPSGGIASYGDLLLITNISMVLGFTQSLTWSMLVSTTFRTIPSQFPKQRSIASAGWLLAGLTLVGLSNATGVSLLLAIGFLFLSGTAAMMIRRGSLPIVKTNNARAHGNLLLLAVAAILATVECRYGINAQSYLFESLGSRCNLFLMAPVAIEILLLMTIAAKGQTCPRTGRMALIAGPLSWMIVIGSLAIYSTYGSIVLLGIAFLAFNVVFQAALAYRLPSDVKGQSALTFAQAIGGLVGYGMTLSDALLGVTLADSWTSTFFLAVGASGLAAAALLREVVTLPKISPRIASASGGLTHGE